MTKYSLTDEAKEAAKYLVENWNAGHIEQEFIALTTILGKGRHEPVVAGSHPNFTCPPFGTLQELSQFDLVKITQKERSWAILLLQELRNAVESDFEIPDSSGTTTAVGNLFVNSTTTGPVQGVGINTGEVYQNIEQLANDLSAKLGEEFLQAETQLREAIDALRTSTEANRQPRFGRVVQELGDCLAHSANTVALIQGLGILARVVL